MHNVSHPKVVDLSDRALERLSAAMDGELESGHPLDPTAMSRQDWDLYHLIGDVLRTPELALANMRLADKVAQSVEQLPTYQIQAVQADSDAPALKSASWQDIWPKLAVAAAIVSVVWIAKPVVEQLRSPTTTAQFARNDVQSLSPAGKMSAYVRAHRGLSGMSAAASLGGSQSASAPVSVTPANR